MIFLISIFLIFLVIFLNKFCIKNKFLLSFSGEKHQTFVTKEKIPLIGGVIFCSLLFFLNFNLNFKITFFLIFLLGIASDLKIISSANIRFIIQGIIVTFSVIILNLEIYNTRIFFLDSFLENMLFNVLFTSFCLIIVINGTNFIDGINLNALSYYLSITVVLYFLSLEYNLELSNIDILKLILILTIISISNFYNKLFLGDNGSYALGFFYGVILINFYLLNQSISPFFIVLLLWYPAFEILFSILRKFALKKSPFEPDNFHLHHILFNFFTKKFTNLKNSKNITGILLNSFNLIVFYFGIKNISHSQTQILLIIMNIIIYLFVYFGLKEKSKNNVKS